MLAAYFCVISVLLSFISFERDLLNLQDLFIDCPAVPLIAVGTDVVLEAGKVAFMNVIIRYKNKYDTDAQRFCGLRGKNVDASMPVLTL